MKTTLFFILITILPFCLKPSPTFAHEVYVLDEQEIAQALTDPQPLHFFQVIQDNRNQFALWGMLAAIGVTLVFLISISLKLESLLDPTLNKLKPWAPKIAQFTLGLALLSSGYHQAFFGVELPMAAFGVYAPVLRLLVTLSGALIILGLFANLAALVTLIIYLTLIIKYQTYMTNYLVYLGEAFAVFFFGTAYSLKPQTTLPIFSTLSQNTQHLKRYKFLIMRLFFGVSLIYAALYAKYLHGQLALATIEKYHLVQFFPFDPLFTVLGAFIIEVLIGAFFLLGIEIRFTSVFYIIFLILSVIFFKESVWPHYVLLGTALSMAIHGYDPYTLEGRFFKHGNREPIF